MSQENTLKKRYPPPEQILSKAYRQDHMAVLSNKSQLALEFQGGLHFTPLR